MSVLIIPANGYVVVYSGMKFRPDSGQSWSLLPALGKDLCWGKREGDMGVGGRQIHHSSAFNVMSLAMAALHFK